MSSLKIAAIQTTQFWGDIEKNLAHFQNKIDAIEEGVDIVLLPEMFSTSFSMNTDLAESESGKAVSWLLKVSQEKSITVMATVMIKENNQFFNRFFVVQSGSIIARYNKRHLFRHAGETDKYTAGDERVIIAYKGWKILLQTCYDLRFPVFTRNKFEEDGFLYDAIIYLANWPERRSYAWSNLLQARAIENQVFAVGVNRLGVDGNDITYNGQSASYDPWGNLIWNGKDEDKVTIIKWDFQELIKLRTTFNTLLDA